ncbi:hypothetical protein M9458_010637, partial [Cirrhinus mrigala]
LPCKKLSPRFIGSFPIFRQVNPVMYELKLPSHYKIHPTFHVSLLKPYYSPVSPVSTEPGPVDDPPLPIVLEDATVYSVKEILSSQRYGGRLEYLVDWKGYSPEEMSWVPRDDILDPNLLAEFHTSHPQDPAPRGRGRPPRRRGVQPSGTGREEGGSVTETPGSSTNQRSQSHTPDRHPPITSTTVIKHTSHTVTLSGLHCGKDSTAMLTCSGPRHLLGQDTI